MIEPVIIHPPRNKPRFFYGYIVVILIFVIHLISFSLYDSFGVFVTPLESDFGWTRAIISGAYSLSFVVMGALGIVMGFLTDRKGPRLALTICGLCLGLGFLLLSQLQEPWQFYLLYGLIVGAGMSGIWAPLLSLVSRWFVQRRGIMTGIVIAGGGIGALAGPPVITRLFQIYSWRLSCLILGGIVLAVMLLATQFLKRDPGTVGQLPYGETDITAQLLESETSGLSLKEAVGTVQFWIVFTMFICLAFLTFSVLVHIVPHAIKMEISAMNAASVLACIGGTSIIGNFIMGRTCDRIGPRLVFVISFILMSSALFWLVQAKELWSLYLFAVVFGFNHGGNATAQAPIVARLFGLKHHGSILGVSVSGFTIGGAVGPLATGYIYDVTHSYQLPFLLCGAIGVVGLILAVILKPMKKLNTPDV